MKFFRTLKLWLKWRRRWEDLCNHCGKCCYTRSAGKDGEIFVYYNFPCEHLDTQTNLCKVYDERFKKCDHCGKVNLRAALYNRTLPKDCPYVQVFRYGNDIKKPNP